jgi:predicted O-methyltransferase YrrM
MITELITDNDIQTYAEAHTSPESELLQTLNRQTHVKVLQPRMLSGHLQGQFLTMISKILKPDHILEIGTFTGYSAICLAEGLTETGRLTTIEVNEERETFTRSFLEQSPRNTQIDFIIGDAAEVIPTLSDTFDLVFIDADKARCGFYYDLVFNKIRVGGVILIDNVLWSGKVVDKIPKPDKATQALLDFNTKIQNDPRVSNVLLPLRDGLMMVMKNID